jgi:hypothetical protein
MPLLFFKCRNPNFPAPIAQPSILRTQDLLIRPNYRRQTAHNPSQKSPTSRTLNLVTPNLPFHAQRSRRYPPSIPLAPCLDPRLIPARSPSKSAMIGSNTRQCP